MIQLFAYAYAGLAALPVMMHLAVASGAPLGHLTVGGRFPGRLPPAWRALALVQAALLATMAGAVLARAGIGTPSLAPLFWALGSGCRCRCSLCRHSLSRFLFLGFSCPVVRFVSRE